MEILYIVAFTLCFSAVSASYVIEESRTSNESRIDSADSYFLAVVKRLAFVDKTLLIKAIVENSVDRVLITAPRGFGKSTNLDMLRVFLSRPVNAEAGVENRWLFEKLNIYKNEFAFFDRHIGKYPVMLVDLQTSLVGNYEDAVRELKRAVWKCYEQHEYLLESERLSDDEKDDCAVWSTPHFSNGSTAQEACGALADLATRIHRHFGEKVTVLIDGYDAITSSALYSVKDNAELERIVKLVASALGKVLENHADVQRAVVTGTSYISTAGLSGLKTNISRYQFLEDHPLVTYYGFTENETDCLFKNPGFRLEASEINKAYSLYDGYESKTGTKVYNPLSIVKFLHHHKAKRYWDNKYYEPKLQNPFDLKPILKNVTSLLRGATGKTSFNHHLTVSDVTKLREMLQNETARGKPDTNLFMFHLFEIGYLKYTSPRGADNRVRIKLANKEMSENLYDIITLWVQNGPT